MHCLGGVGLANAPASGRSNITCMRSCTAGSGLALTVVAVDRKGKGVESKGELQTLPKYSVYSAHLLTPTLAGGSPLQGAGSCTAGGPVWQW
jgi:hypothetical protein